MRIAYISLHWPRTFSSGVGKKIYLQIETWKSLRHEAFLFMHTEDEPVTNLLPSEKFKYLAQTGIRQRELGRIRAATEMLSAVENYQPDIIYLRYGVYIYPLHRLASIAPVVEEINTNDIEQHKELGFAYSSYNRLTRGFFLRSVSGLSSVSEELAKSPAFKKYNKSTRVIANGINLSEVSPLPAPNNSIPRLLFIGEPGHAWHGIDKIINFAKNTPDIEIDIVGYDSLPNHPHLPENLVLHGYLPKEKYLNLFSKADVAISSLAMHRVGLTEASPLKSREYLAYGLPMILAYKDTDIDKVAVDFLLKIPNSEDNIITHSRVIRDFAYKMRGKRVNHKLIAPYIDSQIKEAERLAFFEEIIQHKKTITNEMKLILPRVILGNRGDIASRWALLCTLKRIKKVAIRAVFSHSPEDIPNEIAQKFPYQPFKNIFPSFSGLKSFLEANIVIWGVGLDFQDDASLMKLLYLKVQFSLYRLLGLRIWCLFQGAGPILTSSGQKLAHSILKEVELFVARDPKTLELLKSINDHPRYILGHDAIFLSGLEDDANQMSEEDKTWIDNLTRGIQYPVIGFNIRLWFHFSSSILPFELSKERYIKRANEKMEKLVKAAVENIRYLRTTYKARILLVSAYQPDTVSWEDDKQWLRFIKNHYIDDPEVILVDQYMSMPAYFQFMAQLDLSIGMRLHTTLVSLRMGVPSINLSYTLKGEDILEHLGLSNYAINLEEFLSNPENLKTKIKSILDDLPKERMNIGKLVKKAIKENETLINGLFEK